MYPCTMGTMSNLWISGSVTNLTLGTYSVSITKGGTVMRNNLTLYAAAISNSTAIPTQGGTAYVSLYNMAAILALASPSIIVYNTAATYTLVSVRNFPLSRIAKN